MAKTTGGKKLQAKLQELAGKVGGQHRVRVGFFSTAKYPDGKPVAMIAAIHNFGAPRANIPPRPFFSNMIRKSSPQWATAIAANLKGTNYDPVRTLRLVGQGIAGDLRQSIIDTNSPPLKPATVARKGFAKPLIETPHMINSIGVDAT